MNRFGLLLGLLGWALNAAAAPEVNVDDFGVPITEDGRLLPPVVKKKSEPKKAAAQKAEPKKAEVKKPVVKQPAPQTAPAAAPKAAIEIFSEAPAAPAPKPAPAAPAEQAAAPAEQAVGTAAQAHPDDQIRVKVPVPPKTTAAPAAAPAPAPAPAKKPVLVVIKKKEADQPANDIKMRVIPPPPGMAATHSKMMTIEAEVKKGENTDTEYLEGDEDHLVNGGAPTPIPAPPAEKLEGKGDLVKVIVKKVEKDNPQGSRILEEVDPPATANGPYSKLLIVEKDVKKGESLTPETDEGTGEEMRKKFTGPILPPPANTPPPPARAPLPPKVIVRKPAAPSPKELEVFGDTAPQAQVEQEEDLALPTHDWEQEEQAETDKKGGRIVARKPVAPPRLVTPPPAMIARKEPPQPIIDSDPEKDQSRLEEEVVEEHLPLDAQSYLDTGRTPKYIRINAHGYNVRSLPDENGKSTVDFQAVGGSYFAVSRMVEMEGGIANEIYVDGQKHWVFMPWSRERDFQYCESTACFSDISAGLNALAETMQVNQNSLRACGVTAVDFEGRPVIKPLPRRVADLAPPVSPRPIAELEKLDEKVNRTPTVRPARVTRSGCVEDTRDQRRPNFRNFRSLSALRRAFIDYMTPYALEVQEATGLPASVIIAQAALESGWGKSGLFNSTDNVFGHSCWRRGSTNTLRLNVLGRTKSVTGSCETPRPAGTGGYFLTFRNPQDSVYAYAANLLSRDHNYYPQVRRAVADARPDPADWREVVTGLANYDRPNPNYRNLIRGIILDNGLGRLENKKLCH